MYLPFPQGVGASPRGWPEAEGGAEGGVRPCDRLRYAGAGSEGGNPTGQGEAGPGELDGGQDPGLVEDDHGQEGAGTVQEEEQPQAAAAAAQTGLHHEQGQ